MMRDLLVAAVLVALAGCQSTTPVATATPPASIAPAVTVHAVRDGLYASAQPATSDWPVIFARGVRTVVNLRASAEMAGRDEAAEVASAGMRYVTIPIANAEAITPDAARQLEGVLRSAQAPVLVHCSSGNRTGGLLAIAAAQQEGMPAEQALEIGRRAGMKSTEARVRQLLGLPMGASREAPVSK